MRDDDIIEIHRVDAEKEVNKSDTMTLRFVIVCLFIMGMFAIYGMSGCDERRRVDALNRANQCEQELRQASE